MLSFANGQMPSLGHMMLEGIGGRRDHVLSSWPALKVQKLLIAIDRIDEKVRLKMISPAEQYTQ